MSHRCFVFFIALLILSSSTVLFCEDIENNQYAISIESVFTTQFDFLHEAAPLGWIDVLANALPFNETTVSMRTETGLGVDTTLRLVYEYGQPSHSNIPIGFEGNPIFVENNALYKGLLFFPFFDGEMRIGRQDVSFGPSPLSNLQISRSIPFLDSVYYELPLGPFNISQVIATLENRKGLDDIYFNSDQSPYGFESSVILLSSRRFSVDTELVSLGIGAQSIASRENNAFQIGDVLPIFSLHSADIGWHNLSLFLDGVLRAVEGHTQYCILGIDDINANTFGIVDGGVPTIAACILGASGSFDFDILSLKYELEGTATHYLWGSFYERYYLSRSIYRLKSDSGYITLPLTSPYGPARTSVELRTSLAMPLEMFLKLDGLLLYGDSSINLFSTVYEGRTVEYSFMLARIEATIGKIMYDSASIYLGGGVDFVPAGVVPRIFIGGSWNISIRPH
jgi:hypothetical protein